MDYLPISTVLFFGIVDQIQEDLLSVELSTDSGTIYHLELNKEMFPCRISEGDKLYFINKKNIIEIRCGTPSKKKRKK